MNFDPEIRDYYLYLFLQNLRQLYYDEGENYGFTLESISNGVREVMMGKSWPEALLNKLKVDINMAYSVSKELENDEYIETFESKKGWLFPTYTTYYRLTKKGLKHIKNFNAPRNPIININKIGSDNEFQGNINIGNVNSD